MDPVFQANDDEWFELDKWYFWNEVWADAYGPYETEEEAREELDRYCREVLGEAIINL